MEYLTIAGFFSLGFLLSPILGVVFFGRPQALLSKRLLLISVAIASVNLSIVFLKFKWGFTANNLPLDIAEVQLDSVVVNGVLLTDLVFMLPVVCGAICAFLSIRERLSIREVFKWFVVGFSLHLAGVYCWVVRARRLG